MDERDRGTTLAEVMIVLSVMGILAVPLLGVFRSATRLDDQQTTRNVVRTELEWATTMIADEIRLATPSALLPSGAHPRSTLSLSITDDFGADRLHHWRVGPDGLERTIVDPNNGRTLERSTMFEGVIAEEDQPTFTYADASGRRLDTRSAPTGALADCTTLIGVHLTAPAADRMVTSEVEVAVRSRTPGGNGC